MKCATLHLTRILDARISLLSSQAVFSATQTHKIPALTQSAAEVAGASSNRRSTGSVAMDQLLDGGFKCGSILEISGPPGAAVHAPVIHIVREFVKEGQGVIFAGLFHGLHANYWSHMPLRHAQFHNRSATPRTHTRRWRVLHHVTKGYCSYVCVPDDSVLPHGYRNLLLHTSLLTFQDILIFFHKLPSIIQANRGVCHLSRTLPRL